MKCMSDDARLVSLFLRRGRLMARWNAPGADPDDAAVRRYIRKLEKIDEVIAAEAAYDFLGLAVKAKVVAGDLAQGHAGEETDMIAASLVADLERLAGAA